MDQNVQELNITELRLKKRPLWMSDLSIDDYSDIVGGGGDIYNDRLPPAWPRQEGMELSEAEEQELGPIDLKSFQEVPIDQRQGAQGEGKASGAKMSSFSETMKKTAETATETISGVVDSLKNIFKGEEKKKV